ncbi:MAG: lipoate--protein ligase family protein [Anaerolineae bacterium]|nr:lipoate--protein ligase family protein [Anaerolineae bacterium]
MSTPELSTSYSHTHWRLIVQEAQDGATNMAIDEAIAGHVGAGYVLPTLRLYAWEPACLSLGYAQSIADVDHDRLHQRGWDIVRRLTGGRAILHVDEITYSVSALLDEPRVKGGVIESYRRLSEGLLAGLQNLGALVRAERAAENAPRAHGPVCFEVPSDYEITAQGRKLLGSAQTRRFGTVLQHGALPLHGDVTRICEVLTFADQIEREEAQKRVRRRAITLEDVLGDRPDFALVAEALARGFSQSLNLTFEASQLSPQEQERAIELRAVKYANPEWTGRH